MAANATTMLFAGTNAKDFLLAGWGGNPPATANGSYGQAITLSELAGTVTSNVGTPYGLGPNFPSLWSAVMANMAGNFIPAAGLYAMSAALPKILTKTGVRRNANKLLRGFGLSGVVSL